MRGRWFAWSYWFRTVLARNGRFCYRSQLVIWPRFGRQHGKVVEMVTAMKQAIAGVAPTNFGEVTIMTVWPSHAKFGIAQFLGQLYSIEFPGVYIFRLGYLIALLSIPLALLLWIVSMLPWFVTRYRLTNKRLIVLAGLLPDEERSVALDGFDRIEIVTPTGMEWYNSGNLVFFKGNTETFRIEAVQRPDTFKQTCMKAHLGFVGVKQAEAAGYA
jgi:hypothetical protein